LHAFARPQANGHILWGGWHRRGYPAFKVGDVVHFAHRVAFALDTGRMPKRLKNTCGYRGCISPAHHEAQQ
jgi:hypothetical protein